MKGNRVDGRPHNVSVSLALLATIAVLLTMGPGAGGAGVVEYIPEDVRITGREIHVFSDAGEQVATILGDFKLVMGKHQVSGRDAVVWVREAKAGNATHRDLIVYVKDGAKIVEPGGATTTDRAMLVSLHQQGDFTVSGGNISDKPLTDFPLYKEALTARATETVVVPGEPRQHPSVIGSAGTRPAPASRPATARKPKPIRQVTFEARQGGTSEVRGSRRITIAHDVYLGLGEAERETSLEITSQSAVLFSERRPAKEASVPWSPKFGGAATNLPGSKDERETLVGAYLEGDVIIRGGERTIRAPSAYYDFATDRAVIVDPVFRTIQEQRNIPIYVRADEARALSAREIYFKNAQISTSDFYTPSYSIGATTAKVLNTTPYDDEGVKIGPSGWHAEMTSVKPEIEKIPFFWLPKESADLEEEATSLRKISFGNQGELGFGMETEWNLFRLLGLVQPQGFTARLDLDVYRRGPEVGTKVNYNRDTYSGYAMIYGMVDTKGEDNFGTDRQDIAAPEDRGRILARHKQILPQDWEIQFEISYISDRNYLEEFFPDEYYAGKEQETLIYAKQQRDNWAFTALMQYRLNRFQSQTESAPDLGLQLIGQPLADGALTLFSESHAGIKRYRADNADPDANDTSDWMPRLDTREEVDAPIKLGPLNLVPYAMGRETYWGDTIPGGSANRVYGQVGAKASTSIWRAYKEVSSETWDLNGLKHVINPEATVFFSGEGGLDNSADLFPMEDGIEDQLNKINGYAFAINQRLMTKRGQEGDRQQVEWMHLNVVAGFFSPQQDTPQSDGRFFWYRPEYSIPRNSVDADYSWAISDSTMFLADMNYDIDSSKVGRADVGISVSRDPRLRYYLGWRKITEANSSALTAGVDYQLNRKYTISFFEQYDLAYDNGRNLGTSVSLIRKMERWFGAVTFQVDQRDTGGSNFTMMISFWPEGVPEVKIGNGHSAFNSSSTMN